MKSTVILRHSSSFKVAKTASIHHFCAYALVDATRQWAYKHAHCTRFGQQSFLLWLDLVRFHFRKVIFRRARMGVFKNFFMAKLTLVAVDFALVIRAFWLVMRALLGGFLLLSLASCATSRGEASNSGSEVTGDSECAECGEQGVVELEISNEKSYQEWNLKAYELFDSSAVMGVFPTLSVVAEAPENCRICHSFSAEAIDFDLAHYEDSLVPVAFPKMQRELMLPGMRIPDADSTYLAKFSKDILSMTFAEGKKLSDMHPWQGRSVSEQTFTREVPFPLKKKLQEVALRYNVRYLTIPVRVSVKMLPHAGRSGGYEWKSLWTLWDARYGELVFLNYSEFMAETTSRIAPEREWAKPFAERLGKAFRVKPIQVENH